MGNAVNFLKTVWGKPHGGSNPSACAKNTGMLDGIPVFLLYIEGAEGFEGGSRFAGTKRLQLHKSPKKPCTIMQIVL